MIKTTSIMSKKLWILMLFFILLLIAPIITLMHGVKIENLHLPSLKAKGLYIKLDKKLIVEAKKIDFLLKNSKNETSKEQMQDILFYFPWLNRLFSFIHIEQLNLQDNTIKILYKDDIFYIDSKLLTIDAQLVVKKNTLQATIKSLIFKDFHLLLEGVATGDIQKKYMTFKGRFKSFNINGNLILYLQKNILSYFMNSDKFSSLKPFMEALAEKVEILPEAQDWIYKKIVAKTYKLKSLQGKINLEKGDFFLHDIQGEAKADNVTIRFHKDIPPVLADTIQIKLKNNTLFFELDKAKYQDIILKNQKAHIYNLLTKGNGIVLDLNTTAPLNEDIQKILQTYKLNIPLLQQSGLIDTALRLDIRFVPYDIDVKGKFKTKNSHLLISDVPFYTKNATVTLDNRLLSIDNTNLHYKSLFDINTTGLLNLYNDTYEGNTSINNLLIKSKENTFLHIKEFSMPIFMDIKKDDLHIQLPELKSDLHFKNHTNTISQKSLKTLLPNSPFMKKLNMEDGSLFISTSDFKNLKIDTNISLQKPILSAENKPLTNFHFDIDILEDNIIAKSIPEVLDIKIHNDTTILSVKNANLLLDINQTHTPQANKSKTIIKGIKSNIEILDHNKTILLDNYTLESKEDTIKGEAFYKNGQLKLAYKPSFVQLELNNMDDTFANALINKELFQDGNFSIKITGKDIKNLSGYINLKKTHLKTFATYNNILAFLNSIPALLTFKKPGFNEKGYEVINADILFSKKNDLITIYTLDINGIDADIIGSGTIDLSNETLNLKLKLKTLKDVSDIIEKIPLVNYIILGKDKSIETGIRISGTLDDPKVETQTLQDMVFSPFNILKRTLTLPFNLLSQEKR